MYSVCICVSSKSDLPGGSASHDPLPILAHLPAPNQQSPLLAKAARLKKGKQFSQTTSDPGGQTFCLWRQLPTPTTAFTQCIPETRTAAMDDLPNDAKSKEVVRLWRAWRTVHEMVADRVR